MLDVRIESESRARKAELLDERGLTGRRLALEADPGSCCLRFIDPYGDTVLNPLQLLVPVLELRSLVDGMTDDDLVTRGEARLPFLEGAKDAHTYVWFIGD